jgi:hypothetical protein
MNVCPYFWSVALLANPDNIARLQLQLFANSTTSPPFDMRRFSDNGTIVKPRGHVFGRYHDAILPD